MNDLDAFGLQEFGDGYGVSWQAGQLGGEWFFCRAGIGFLKKYRDARGVPVLYESEALVPFWGGDPIEYIKLCCNPSVPFASK